jgi:Rieske Fe-S protein
MREQEDAAFNRREFLIQGSIAVAGASFCLCGLGGCATITGSGATSKLTADALARTDGDIVIDLAKAPDLAAVGGAAKIVDRKDVKPIIIARVAERSFVVVSILCPHRGVEVEYQHERKHFVCASIGSSAFGLDGARLRGPAKKPIQSFENTFADGKLTIRGVAV